MTDYLDLTEELLLDNDRLSDREHEQWARWQKYLHSKLEKITYNDSDGNEVTGYVLSEELFDYWEKQINTLYHNLSDKEKEYYEKEVEKYINDFHKLIKIYDERCTEMFDNEVAGWENGFENGYENGYKEAWNEGFDEGCRKGWEDGHNDGYLAAKIDHEIIG